jgi:hypothetical protein
MIYILQNVHTQINKDNIYIKKKKCCLHDTINNGGLINENIDDSVFFC